MTADQVRRKIRMELHAARCRDGDQSPERYGEDAAALDSRMSAAGFEPKHPTTWGIKPAHLRGEQNAGLAAFRLLESTNAQPDDSEYQPTPASAL
jgi:hypothetical protein